MGHFVTNSVPTPGGASPNAVAVSKYGRFLLVASSAGSVVEPYYNINYTEPSPPVPTQNTTENATANATETVNATEVNVDTSSIRSRLDDAKSELSGIGSKI